MRQCVHLLLVFLLLDLVLLPLIGPTEVDLVRGRFAFWCSYTLLQLSLLPRISRKSGIVESELGFDSPRHSQK